MPGERRVEELLDESGVAEVGTGERCADDEVPEGYHRGEELQRGLTGSRAKKTYLRSNSKSTVRIRMGVPGEHCEERPYSRAVCEAAGWQSP